MICVLCGAQFPSFNICLDVFLSLRHYVQNQFEHITTCTFKMEGSSESLLIIFMDC